MTVAGKAATSGIWVVGATFGAHYARALAHCRLNAIIGRGSAGSVALAQALGCPYYADLEQALSGPRPACAIVVVRSAIVGGEGDEITRRLLEAGIPVLQELPVHPQEMVKSLRVARRYGVHFGLTAFYDSMPPVRRFLRSARQLMSLTRVRSVEMRTTVQTLHCALFVLLEALGVTPANSATAIPMACEEKVLIGSHWGGIPVDIVLMNRLDTASPDNNSQPLMQITLLSDEGELTLHSPYGQVIWERQLHQSGVTAWLPSQVDYLPDEPVIISSLPPAQYNASFLSEMISEAVRTSVTDFMNTETQDTARLQRQLAVLQAWQTMCIRAGRPVQYQTHIPQPIGMQLGLTEEIAGL